MIFECMHHVLSEVLTIKSFRVFMSAAAPSGPMLYTPMLRHSLYYLWLTYTARGVQVHCVMICDLITLDSGTLYDSLINP